MAVCLGCSNTPSRRESVGIGSATIQSGPPPGLRRWRGGFHLAKPESPQPIVDFSALKIRNFGLGSLFSFVQRYRHFTTIYLTPLFLDVCGGFSALQIGFAVFLDRPLPGLCDSSLHRSCTGASICAG